MINDKSSKDELAAEKYAVGLDRDGDYYLFDVMTDFLAGRESLRAERDKLHLRMLSSQPYYYDELKAEQARSAKLATRISDFVDASDWFKGIGELEDALAEYEAAK